MISELPEQLLAQAEFLVYEATVNEANLRRSVSSAYYAIFHLLIRAAIESWKYPAHRGRLARTFDHKRMKDAWRALLRELESIPGNDPASKLSTVALAFVELQHTRQTADYDIEEPFDLEDARVAVEQAGRAFLAWAEAKDDPIAQRYRYTVLFKDRS